MVRVLQGQVIQLLYTIFNFFYVFFWLLSVYCNSETLFYRKDIQISTESEADQTLELKIFVKQLMNHSNFVWFALMNLIQVSTHERKTSWKHEPHSKSWVFPNLSFKRILIIIEAHYWEGPRNNIWNGKEMKILLLSKAVIPHWYKEPLSNKQKWLDEKIN